MAASGLAVYFKAAAARPTYVLVEKRIIDVVAFVVMIDDLPKGRGHGGAVVEVHCDRLDF